MGLRDRYDQLIVTTGKPLGADGRYLSEKAPSTDMHLERTHVPVVAEHPASEGGANDEIANFVLSHGSLQDNSGGLIAVILPSRA